jgi:peptidoglycan/LPS O-acetylase OafA/YrhL
MSANSRNLDLLRAFAVLCVLVFHVVYCIVSGDFAICGFPGYLFGQIGVLLFFVHTSFVLMLSMARMSSCRLAINFYIRRVFRIYPLSMVCIITVLLFHIPDLPRFGHMFMTFRWPEVLSSLLLVQNVFYSHKQISSPLWSLSYEIQMYLALPFIFFLLKRISSNVVVLLLWIALIAAAVHIPLLMYGPCFMGGVFAYQLSKERTFALPPWVFPTSGLALVLLYLVGRVTVLPDARSDYLLCMFLGIVIPNVLDLQQSWITKTAHEIARYSYGIYLSHVPILWFCFIKLSSLPILVRWSAFVVLMIVVPFAVYTWIEEPCIRIGRRVAESNFSIAFLKVKEPVHI